MPTQAADLIDRMLIEEDLGADYYEGAGEVDPLLEELLVSMQIDVEGPGARRRALKSGTRSLLQ
jgi:hypothetical protein